MRVFSRESPRTPGHRVWYAELYYWEGDRRVRAKRSTGVLDDGSRQSQRTAEIIARDIAQSLALGKGRIARPTSITKAVDLLIAKLERGGRAQATINIVIEKARHLTRYFGAGHPCESFTDQNLEQYADHRLGAGAARLTVHRELQTLRSALVAAGFKPPAMPDLGELYTPGERFLDHGESMRLLAATPPAWLDHVVMYRLLGLTKSELYRIARADIDWKRSEVRVRGTKAKQRDRVLPMPLEVQAILRAREHRAPMFDAWINANRDLAAASARAGLGRISFNDLRRSFATELAVKGVPPLHLMHLMGHASLRMLELVYARVGQGQHMHDAIAKLDSLGSPKREPAVSRRMRRNRT